MGWASAGEIFDPVARALIELNASDELKRRVLGTLIEHLRDGDWDTYGESMEEFRDDSAILAAFHANGCGNTFDSGSYDPEGTLDWDERHKVWTLRCSHHGEVGRGGDSAAEHDRLVVEWAAHDRDLHGGSGRVDRGMLCDPSVVS